MLRRFGMDNRGEIVLSESISENRLVDIGASGLNCRYMDRTFPTLDRVPMFMALSVNATRLSRHRMSMRPFSVTCLPAAFLL